MCAHASLSQDGFCHKDLWVVSIVQHHSLFDLQGTLSVHLQLGGLLTSKMRNMWSGQGPASSLNHPAILFLEYLPWRGGRGEVGHLPPGSMTKTLFPVIKVLSHCKQFFVMDRASSYTLLRGLLLFMKQQFSVSVREHLIRVGPRTQVSQESLVHPCWCCYQMHLCVLVLHSEAKQIKTWQCGAEKGLLQGQARGMGGLC